MKNKNIIKLIILFIMINSSICTAQNNNFDDNYIDLDIGECILKIPVGVHIRINSDFDATFYDIKNNDVYILSWRKDALEYLKQDLKKEKYDIRIKKHLKIIEKQNSSFKKIIGRNFFITISSDSKSLKKQVQSCNNSWRENSIQIDIETMINNFSITDDEVKILEKVIKTIYSSK